MSKNETITAIAHKGNAKPLSIHQLWGKIGGLKRENARLSNRIDELINKNIEQVGQCNYWEQQVQLLERVCENLLEKESERANNDREEQKPRRGMGSHHPGVRDPSCKLRVVR